MVSVVHYIGPKREHEGKRPLGRHRCMLDDNIKMDLREIEYSSIVVQIHLAQDKGQSRVLVTTVKNLRVPENLVGSQEGFSSV
jgi:hypothetical protein